MPRSEYTTPAGRGVGAIELAAEDVVHFERLANSLLNGALVEYDHFVGINRRRVDATHWRHWHRDGGVSVYRKHHQGSRSNGGDIPHLELSTPHTTWPKTTPRLLAVGSLASSLDDVLYGTVTPTAATMRLRASYSTSTGDGHLDGAVLAQIRTPTPSEPFRFLGVKWVLQRGLGGTGFGLVRPRDFVFLESTGIQIRQDGSGQRVGFHIMHSVDLPQFAASSTHGKVQRGAFSACYLYHELANGAVDVYMTAAVQPRGNLIASMAVRAAASLLTTNWHATALFAENKKLAWLLETQRQLHRNDPPPTSPSPRCGVCAKSFKGSAKSKKNQAACQLCTMIICSQCTRTRTLCTEGIALHSVISTEMAFCKKCFTIAGETNASEIASEQLQQREAIRRGRAHTQAALERCGITISHYQSQWTDVDASDRHPYNTYGDGTHAGGGANAVSVTSSACEAQGPRLMSRSHATNSTWNGSARPTETLSIGSIAGSTLSFQDASYDDAGRNITAGIPLVLLDNRKSPSRAKALGYRHQTPESTPRMSMTSIVDPDRDDTELESAYSDTSETSSIAVLSPPDANRESCPSLAKNPGTPTDASGSSPLQQDLQSQQGHSVSSVANQPGTNQQQRSFQTRLWHQMNALRATAESTFQTTQRNTEAIASQNPAFFRDWCLRSEPLGHVNVTAPTQ